LRIFRLKLYQLFNLNQYILYDSLVKLAKFIKYYIFIDIDKLMVSGEIVNYMNTVFIYIKIFLKIITLLLNLNLGVFIISIIL